ncbi:MAG: hypothetical protein R2857_15590 [Vampirovibrionales bacterium]
MKSTARKAPAFPATAVKSAWINCKRSTMMTATTISALITPAPQLPPLPDAYDVGSNLAFANQTLSINSIVADAYYDRLFDNTRDSLSAGGWGEDGVSQKNIQSELDHIRPRGRLDRR